MNHGEDWKIGVALSSGGAGGLAHIGVLEELRGAGLDVTCIAGTSAGAIVGAALASDRLQGLRDRFTTLGLRERMALFDLSWLGGGLFAGRRAMEMVRPFVGELIEELPRKFAAVATDLETGDEVVLQNGSTLDALRASIAIPGVLVPWAQDGRLLVDGALANPIPISVSRALGADFVIGVNLIPAPYCSWVRDAGATAPVNSWFERSWRAFSSWRTSAPGEEAEIPTIPPDTAESVVAESVSVHNLAMVLSRSSALIQARIAATRLREEPADFLIEPDIREIGVFDFHRAVEAVEAGREAARAALPALLQHLSTMNGQRRWGFFAGRSDSQAVCAPHSPVWPRDRAAGRALPSQGCAAGLSPGHS